MSAHICRFKRPEFVCAGCGAYVLEHVAYLEGTLGELEARLKAAEACLGAVFTPGELTADLIAAYDAWQAMRKPR